jgi:putative effector of murein hydrolase LrgA (UPF0299 family)
MTETDKRARIAGGIYLLSAIPGFFSLMYVPRALIVRGDPGATMSRILASEALFRWGVAGELLGAVLWIFLMRALYRLLADVDRGQAWLMVVLSLMAVPIMAVNVLSELAVLTMLRDPRFGAAFAPDQLQALVSLALRANAQGYTVAAVFWGLWLFPFASLVWRSGFLPRFLGGLLAIGGVGWLASTVTALVAPSYSPAVDPIASLARSGGELPIIFWLLLLVGARARPAAGGARDASSAAAKG